MHLTTHRILLIVALVSLVSFGCQKEAAAPHVGTWEELPNADDFAPDGRVQDEQLGGFHVVIETSIDGGSLAPMVFELWPQASALTVRNFLRLCRSGFYDGLTFHRVVGDFMIQGGCIRGDGLGDSPFGSIRGEFSEDLAFAHSFGVLSMARGEDSDSAGAQFFVICRNGPKANSLNGAYASFGKLVAGDESLRALSEVPVTRARSREISQPVLPIRIEEARVVLGPAPAPEENTAPQETAPVAQVDSLLITTREPAAPPDRTFEEAEALAQSLLRQAKDGADFLDLVRQHSEDPVQRDQPNPVGFRFLDGPAEPGMAQPEVAAARRTTDQALADLQEKKHRGEIEGQAVLDERDRLVADMQRTIRTHVAIPRKERAALADVAFDMSVGEVRLIAPDEHGSLEGFYLVKRTR